VKDKTKKVSGVTQELEEMIKSEKKFFVHLREINQNESENREIFLKTIKIKERRAILCSFERNKPEQKKKVRFLFSLTEINRNERRKRKFFYSFNKTN